jgi:hypothetical protein
MPSGYKDEAARGQRRGIELGNGDRTPPQTGGDPLPPPATGGLARNLLLFCGLGGLPRAKFVQSLGLRLKSSF